MMAGRCSTIGAVTRSSSVDVGLIVPARRRGHEILDDAGVDTATRIRSLADVRRRAAVNAVAGAVRPGMTLTILDVGTGLADIPEAIAAFAGRGNARVVTIGLDEAFDLLRQAGARLTAPVCGNARALPFRDSSIDVVVCSQLLHHFADGELEVIITELDRVARSLVVISDLRRSWIAAAGFWLASFPLGFHSVTRHDGVVSVFRGFTPRELRGAVSRATGVVPRVERKLGFRLTASWTPRAA